MYSASKSGALGRQCVAGIGNDRSCCHARRESIRRIRMQVGRGYASCAGAETRMQQLRLRVPTYNANLFPTQIGTGSMPEFGPPHIPVVIHPAEGIRIVLGSYDSAEWSRPEVQIERQPNGWVIFLRPVGGGDASGLVYLLEDGRSFVVPELGGQTTPIRQLHPSESIPGFTFL